MSIDRETIAKYYKVKPEEVTCGKCAYGSGKFLVECGFWNRIMGEKEFCTFWGNGHAPEAPLPKVIEDAVMEKLDDAVLHGIEKPVDAVLHMIDLDERRKNR